VADYFQCDGVLFAFIESAVRDGEHPLLRPAFARAVQGAPGGGVPFEVFHERGGESVDIQRKCDDHHVGGDEGGIDRTGLFAAFYFFYR